MASRYFTASMSMGVVLSLSLRAEVSISILAMASVAIWASHVRCTELSSTPTEASSWPDVA